MNRAITFLLLLFTACLCSCSTAEIVKANGDKLKHTSFMTNYNYGTTVNDTSDTNILPLPIGGGAVKGTDSLTPVPNDEKWAVTIGGADGIRIGQQDQGTPLGIAGKWLYKMERAFLIFKGITSITGDYFSNKKSDTAASVAKEGIKSDADVTKHISDNRLQGAESLGLPGEVPFEGGLKTP